MQLSGVNTVTYYMEIIIRKANVTILEPATIVIIVNGIGTYTTFDQKNILLYIRQISFSVVKLRERLTF